MFAILPLAGLLSGNALAQDTLDIGMLKNEHVTVVQKMLYEKEGALEFGGHLGWMPFDTYTSTPIIAATGGLHLSETLGAEVALSGGYSLKNTNYKLIEGPAYGLSPDAYRYWSSFTANALWTPVYAKLAWRGSRVLHHDFYGLAGIGGSVEQSMMPDGAMAISPTLALGVGARIFLKSGNTLRLQVRDELLREKRVKTVDSQAYFLKQNVALTVGYTVMRKKG